MCLLLKMAVRDISFIRLNLHFQESGIKESGLKNPTQSWLPTFLFVTVVVVVLVTVHSPDRGVYGKNLHIAFFLIKKCSLPLPYI